jgi:5-methylcytosine-specific restriction endonuclease McrA
MQRRSDVVPWKPFRNAKTRAEWRELLMLRQHGLCALCGHRFPRDGEVNQSVAIEFSPTFDHVIPRSQGGADDFSNFRLVHRGCNRARGDGNAQKAAPSIPKALRVR